VTCICGLAGAAQTEAFNRRIVARPAIVERRFRAKERMKAKILKNMVLLLLPLEAQADYLDADV
jgi:hypothetical protein